jgi:hypothetical protein
MTVREWCDFNHLSLHQYYYWRRRLAELANPKEEKDRWQVVDILNSTSPPTPAAVPLNVRIAGAAIEVVPGFDPALLRAVVAALATPPC